GDGRCPSIARRSQERDDEGRGRRQQPGRPRPSIIGTGRAATGAITGHAAGGLDPGAWIARDTRAELVLLAPSRPLAATVPTDRGCDACAHCVRSPERERLRAAATLAGYRSAIPTH